MHKSSLWLVATSCSAILLLAGCQQESSVTPEPTQTTSLEKSSLLSETEAIVETQQALAVPGGFVTIQSAPGVTLYKKHFAPPGAPDYVQEINLAAGAKVRFHMGTWRQATGTTPSPIFMAKSLATYWNEQRNLPKIFSITNGTFAEGAPEGQFAQVSYPVKSDGNVYTAGFSNNDAYPKRILKIYSDFATIQDYNSCPPNEPSWKCNAIEPVQAAIGDAPTAIVGMHPLNANANGKKHLRIGRTFLGTKDGNGDGKPEILYIYTSLKATQAEARQVLLDFGATWTIMLDGSGSTQMTSKGINYVPSSDNRPITGIISVFSN